MLRTDTDARTEPRNDDESNMNWQFTTEDARIKLQQCYPTV